MKKILLITFSVLLVIIGSGISYSQEKEKFYEPVKIQIEVWTVSLDPRLVKQ